jgi:polygalacturonase
MRKKNSIATFFTLIASLSAIQVSATEFRQNDQSPAYYNVINFGAKADGQVKDTYFVQNAIDSCSARGGGTVYFPPGTYLCGSLHLKSNIALYLDHGAVIMMSKDNEDFDPYEQLDFKSAGDKETSYFHYALIWGEDIEHVSIMGTGIIDGNRPKRGGPKPIALKRCRYVSIRDITLKNAPNYNISMLGTDFVTISGVTILNGYSDGIDPDACQNVRISDCYIDCYDDAIVPKASFSLGVRRSVENLTVTNCILASNCNAFKFGTESGGGFKNVTVSNCTILARKVGRPADSGISLESVDGAEIEGVTISNISMTTITSPIFLRLGNRGRDMETPTPGYLRNVMISNITATGATQASIIAGIPGFPIENITLNNIKIGYVGGGSFAGKIESVPEQIKEYPDSDMFGPIPSWGFYCRHAKNLKLQEIDLTLNHPDKRSAFIFEDVTRLKIAGANAERGEGAPAVMRFKDIKQVTISGCMIPKDKSVFIDVPVNQKNEIQLIDNGIIQK